METPPRNPVDREARPVVTPEMLDYDRVALGIKELHRKTFLKHIFCAEGRSILRKTFDLPSTPHQRKVPFEKERVFLTFCGGHEILPNKKEFTIKRGSTFEAAIKMYKEAALRKNVYCPVEDLCFLLSDKNLTELGEDVTEEDTPISLNVGHCSNILVGFKKQLEDIYSAQ